MSGLDEEDGADDYPDEVDPDTADSEDADGDDVDVPEDVEPDEAVVVDAADAELDGFDRSLGDDDLDDYVDADEDLKVVDEALSHKDQNARALAIRRAIEERLEAKRLSRDLDYLDMDSDD